MVEFANNIKGFVWRNEVTTGTKRLPRSNFAPVLQREVRGVNNSTPPDGEALRS